MNISGNLKSLASWCSGYNNAESALKVCKGTYFFNTDDHEKPTLTAKAKQIGEESAKVFLKHATINGLISLPFTDMGYVNPTNPNTITGIFQHLSKIPYCLVKSALKMNSDFCPNLPVQQIINNIPKPTFPTRIIPEADISLAVLPNPILTSAINRIAVFEESFPPTPNFPEYLNGFFKDYEMDQAVNKNVSAFEYYLFVRSYIKTYTLSQTLVQAIKNEIFNSSSTKLAKCKNISKNAAILYATVLTSGLAFWQPSLVSYSLFYALNHTYGVLQDKRISNSEKIGNVALSALVYMYPSRMTPLLHYSLTDTLSIPDKISIVDKIQSIAFPALVYMYPTILTPEAYLGLDFIIPMIIGSLILKKK